MITDHTRSPPAQQKFRSLNCFYLHSWNTYCQNLDPPFNRARRYPYHLSIPSGEGEMKNFIFLCIYSSSPCYTVRIRTDVRLFYFSQLILIFCILFYCNLSTFLYISIHIEENKFCVCWKKNAGGECIFVAFYFLFCFNLSCLRTVELYLIAKCSFVHSDMSCTTHWSRIVAVQARCIQSLLRINILDVTWLDLHEFSFQGWCLLHVALQCTSLYSVFSLASHLIDHFYSCKWFRITPNVAHDFTCDFVYSSFGSRLVLLKCSVYLAWSFRLGTL